MRLLVIAAFLTFWVVQVCAFFAGAHAWFGLGFPLGLLFAVLLSILPFTALTIGTVSFYGACYGWDWSWWQAFPLAAPTTAFWIACQVMGGVEALVSTVLPRPGSHRA